MEKTPVPAKKKAIPAHISLPADLIAELKKTAFGRGQSLSGHCREILLAHLASLKA